MLKVVVYESNIHEGKQHVVYADIHKERLGISKIKEIVVR